MHRSSVLRVLYWVDGLADLVSLNFHHHGRMLIILTVKKKKKGVGVGGGGRYFNIIVKKIVEFDFNKRRLKD